MNPCALQDGILGGVAGQEQIAALLGGPPGRLARIDDNQGGPASFNSWVACRPTRPRPATMTCPLSSSSLRAILRLPAVSAILRATRDSITMLNV
jgi:hypothetical protein